jgi:hypothetical protein
MRITMEVISVRTLSEIRREDETTSAFVDPSASPGAEGGGASAGLGSAPSSRSTSSADFDTADPLSVI